MSLTDEQMVSFNDRDNCRQASNPQHRCIDKYGEPFASWQRPARPASVCWFETLARREEARHEVIDLADALAEAVHRFLEMIPGAGDGQEGQVAS